jgi:hypothetical protein
MKKIALVAFATLIGLFVTSCKKSSSTDNPNPGNNSNNPTYYVNFKVNGVAVSETEVTGTRGTTTDPRTLTISGTGTSAANPKFKFYSEESFIGFVQGLTVGNKTNTYPSDYIEYTDAAGVLYSTQNNSDGVTLSFSDISYAKDGVATGTFSGSITTAGGVTAQITDGTFNVKFGN